MRSARLPVSSERRLAANSSPSAATLRPACTRRLGNLAVGDRFLFKPAGGLGIPGEVMDRSGDEVTVRLYRVGWPKGLKRRGACEVWHEGMQVRPV